MTTWTYPLTASVMTPTLTWNGAAASLVYVSGTGTGTIVYNIESPGATVVGTFTLDGTNLLSCTVKNTSGAAAFFTESLLLTLPNTSTPTMLDQGGSTPGVTASMRSYPYVWDAQQEPFRNPQGDLIVAGFKYNGNYHVLSWNGVAATELAEIKTQYTSPNYLITFYRSNVINNGHDTVTNTIPLGNGNTDYFELTSGAVLNTILNAIFGTPTTLPASFRLTTIENTGWDAAGAAYTLTLAQLQAVAANLAGNFDYVICRSAAPSANVVNTFHAQGIKVLYYMFLSAIQSTQTSYSDSAGDCAEIIDNKTWPSGQFLYDSLGSQYLTTCCPGGWQFMDVRGTGTGTAHDCFVTIAKLAMNTGTTGYDGIFLDGAEYFYGGGDGYVGGYVSGATQSYQAARIALAQDIKTAIQGIDAAALLIGTANVPYAGLHVLDGQLKEVYGSSWVNNDSNPFEVQLTNSNTYGEAWADGLQPYYTSGLIIGQKGANPLLVGTGFYWAGVSGTQWYTDCGDVQAISSAFTIGSAVLSQILAANSTYQHNSTNGNWIDIGDLSQIIESDGVSVIWSKKATTIGFYRSSTPALYLGDPINGKQNILSVIGAGNLAMIPNARYICGDRKTTDWFWAGYGLAYDTQDGGTNYIFGDFELTAPPTGTKAGTMKFPMQLQPGALNANDTNANLGYFTAHTIECQFSTTPISWSIYNAAGTMSLVGPTAPGSGNFAVDPTGGGSGLTAAAFSQFQFWVRWV